MKLREFLENREHELVREIDECHGKLAPLEAELAEVRRAKGALGMPPRRSQRPPRSRAAAPSAHLPEHFLIPGAGKTTVRR